MSLARQFQLGRGARFRAATLRHETVVWTVTPHIIVGLALAYFVVSAARNIALPGLYYDELLFVNASVGSPTNAFVAWRVLGVPVMLMSYIGALKAYLYAPIFAVFGVSPETIRLPAVGLSLLSLVLVRAIARMSYGRFTSVALVWVIAIDPLFIFMTKLDFGPIVLMMFFKLTATWAFLKLVSAHQLRYLWLLVGAAACGLFDKLNFIWFIVALFAAAVLFRADLQDTARRAGRLIIAPVALLTLLVTGSGLTLILPQLAKTSAAGIDVSGRLVYALGLYSSTTNGDELYNWVMGTQVASWPIVAAVTAGSLGIIAFSFLLALRRGWTFGDRVTLFYAVVFVAIFGQIVLTNKADGAHHIMVLYPFQFFLAFAAVGLLGRKIRAWRRARLLPLTLLVAILSVAEVSSGLRYAAAFSQGSAFQPTWSPAIYDVAAYVNERDVDRVISVDWGINNEVLALGRPETRARDVDLWQTFDRPSQTAAEAALFDQYVKGKRVLFIAHSAETEVMANSHEHLLEFLAQVPNGGSLEHVFQSSSGTPLFEIYFVDDRAV